MGTRPVQMQFGHAASQSVLWPVPQVWRCRFKSLRAQFVLTNVSLLGMIRWYQAQHLDTAVRGLEDVRVRHPV